MVTHNFHPTSSNGISTFMKFISGNKKEFSRDNVYFYYPEGEK